MAFNFSCINCIQIAFGLTIKQVLYFSMYSSGKKQNYICKSCENNAIANRRNGTSY